MNRIINFATRYTTHYTKSDGNSFYPVNPKFTRFEYCYLSEQKYIIHYEPLADILRNFQSEDPNGSIYNEVFRWSTPTPEKAYSILISDGEITYEIQNGSCKTDTASSEKGLIYALFLNMILKKNSPLKLDKIKTMTNAGKYTPYSSFFKAELPIYPVKEGVVNIKGELILPLEVKKHRYINHKYLIVNDRYLLNKEGEILLEDIYIDHHLKMDLFTIKQDDQYKTYDAKAKRWIESNE